MAKNAKTAADKESDDLKSALGKKELDDLVSALGENRLPLRKPCMQGTRIAILQKIENDIKNVDDHSVIWIRGSPGVGKSALAASMAAWLREQDRHVVPFRFDRTQSSTITTDALWRAVALDLARLYPSVCQHIHKIVQGNMLPDPYDIDGRFKCLIETPLFTLNDVPPEKLPVIVVDALDECGGLRNDSSGKDDFEGLMHTLKHWIQAEHLSIFSSTLTILYIDHFSFSCCILSLPPCLKATITPHISQMLTRDKSLPLALMYLGAFVIAPSTLHKCYNLPLGCPPFLL